MCTANYTNDVVHSGSDCEAFDTLHDQETVKQLVVTTDQSRGDTDLLAQRRQGRGMARAYLLHIVGVANRCCLLLDHTPTDTNWEAS